MWDILWAIVIFAYIVSCVGLVFLILIQETRSGGLAGIFGAGGGSQTLFGSGAFEFVQKLTLYLAAAFFLLALLLMFRKGTLRPSTEMEGYQSTPVETQSGTGTEQSIPFE